MLTRDELYDELNYYFNGNISKRMMLRHLKGLNRNDENYQSKLAHAIDDMFEEVRENEVRKANKVLDKIKKAYGYKELGLSVMFSNGEAWYDYV
jgi:DNA polymerase I-like protein with 3'-5' exonuclease and polymerase domains